MSISMNDDKVQLMIEMKRRMESSITSSSPDIFFSRLYDSVCEYVNMNCNHNYIEDYIDTSPDKTQQIEYCIHCYESPPPPSSPSPSPISSKIRFNRVSEREQIPNRS